MSSVDTVERAQRMARQIEDYEYGYGGDRRTARSRAARKYGLSAGIFRRLRYDPPKQIAVDIYNALCEAAEDVAQRQIKKLEGEIHEARQSRFVNRDSALREAETYLGEARALLNRSRDA